MSLSVHPSVCPPAYLSVCLCLPPLSFPVCLELLSWLRHARHMAVAEVMSWPLHLLVSMVWKSRRVMPGCSSVGASDQHTTDAGSKSLMWQGIFSPRVSFQCRLSYSVHTPSSAIVRINICAHIKDHVVHVRVWWIMAT